METEDHKPNDLSRVGELLGKTEVQTYASRIQVQASARHATVTISSNVEGTFAALCMESLAFITSRSFVKAS